MDTPEYADDNDGPGDDLPEVLAELEGINPNEVGEDGDDSVHGDAETQNG